MTLSSIITTSVFLITAVTISGAASAAEFSQYPFGNPSKQADQSILLAEAKDDDAKAEQDQLNSEICLKFTADPDAEMRALLKAGCEPSLVQVSKLMDNPLGSLAAMINQFDMTRLKNEKTGNEANMGVYTGIMQFPTKINDDWNLVNRIIITATSVPVDQDKIDAIGSGSFNPGTPGGPGSGGSLDSAIGGRTTGLGDSYYVGLFAPKGIDLDGLAGKFVWGVGFDIAFPTAQDDVLGADKWSAGPSAVAAYLGPSWKLGALVMHYKDFAGDDFDSNGIPVGDVNLTNLQYFAYYALSPTDSIGAAPNIIMDWEAGSGDKFTVPIGIGYAKTVKIGKIPVRFGIEYYNSVIQPDTVGADWGVRFYMIPAVPSAMFDWMAG